MTSGMIKALIAGVVALSPSSRAAASDEHPCRMEDKECHKIEQSLRDWVRAFNERDIDGVMAVWADDVVGWYPDGDVVGRPATRQQYAAITEPGFSTNFSVKIVEIHVSGATAYVRDIWRAADGEAEQVYKSFEIWNKGASGDWRITRWISFPEPRKICDGDPAAE